jgi:hypothetical protein
LFGPFLRLIEYPELYDQQDKAETIARYFAEFPILAREFRAFCVGQPGHYYHIQNHEFERALDSARELSADNPRLADVVRQKLNAARAAIDAVPVPRTSVSLEAGSPFTAYRKLRELCEADVTTSVTWLDPYFGADIFLRYIGSVRRNVPVTLVTSEPGSHAGRVDMARWAGFLDASRLYAQELGPAAYRLVIQPNLHDRWVVFDDKRIYALGGSVKDAGDKDYFTITSVEASQVNLGKIQAQIATGTEYLGLHTPQHR